MTVTPDTKKALLAGCFGLAGTLIPVALSWSKDRDTASQRSKQLDEATKRVQFWDQWLKLSTSLGDVAGEAARQRVQHELEMLCQLLAGASVQLHTEQAALQDHTTTFDAKVKRLSFPRRLLLLYKPARGIAWLPRIFYFFFLALAIFDGATGPHDQDTVFGVFGFLMIASVFGFLSHLIEKPRKEVSEVSAASPPLPPGPGGASRSST